jgi:HPt (histidine-containing phosphotransfer) domain-containing protein
MAVPYFEIAGIDVRRGVSLTGGTIENYKETLAIFHTDALKRIDELRECAKSNINLYIILVHALKSAAANIGALEIARKAKALEEAGREGDIAFIEENTEFFLEQLEILLQNIDSVVLSQGDYKALDEDDIIFLKTELAKVQDALEIMDIRTITTIMTSLQSQKWDKKTRDILKNISEKILIFEYEDAAKIIDTIISE